MGYFAVLTTDAKNAFSVPRCHINVWSLPGLWPRRRLLYVDVGLEIDNTTTSPISELDLLLPFRVEEGKWPDGTTVVQDLYDSMRNLDDCELIFGGPVEQSQQGDSIIVKVAAYSQNSTLTVGRILPAQAQRDDKYQRSDISLYRVPLATPLNPGDRRYVRMRWRVLEPGQMWRTKYFRSGARLDFRICDVRESRFASQERSLRERVVDLAGLNFFVMVSPRLDPVSSSPDFKKRTLETGAWRDYLRGSSYFGLSKGLVVYSCKHPRNSGSPAARNISADNPYRIYLSLSRATNRTWTADVLRTAFGVLLAFLLVGGLSDTGRLLGIFSGIGAAQLYAALSLIGVSTFFGALAKVRSWAATRFLAIRKRLRAVERILLKLTQSG